MSESSGAARSGTPRGVVTREDGGVAVVRHVLAGLGLLPDDAELEPLSGGVSSDIWLVRGGPRPFIVKRPRERLKVAADWTAPIDRGASEAAWLEYVADAVPGACPRVLGYDPETFAIALEYVDTDTHPNWKSELMAGRVVARFAGAVGQDLGRIHAASVRTAGLADRFDHQDLFETLRIEPYLVRTASAVPEARGPLERVIDELRSTRIALVHGDVSPKNILAGEDPVFLDAECATWSDPAFDAAFCLTHLTLKELHLPEFASALRAAAHAFEARYLEQTDWADAAALRARITRIVPALMLARVSGASPAEYLTDSARRRVGVIATEALTSGRRVEDIIDEGVPS